MEDEERQKKLEAGKAKLAEYRQRKAHADGQRKQKKKKRKGAEDSAEREEQGRDELEQDHSVGEEVTRGRPDAPTSEVTFARTLRSGETVKHDQTYTIEPESEVSTTAEDYTSEEEELRQSEAHSEHGLRDSPRSQLQIMEEELAAKSQIVEELSRELEEIRAAFGSDGVQQLQDFEAALNQRDGIITQLTANLQQARKEKDEVMREFLELTEQSQKLKIQFQQLQAGETLRSSSHSSTAVDLLQARQQVALFQQQLEERETQLRAHLVQIDQLQHTLDNTEMVRRGEEESFTKRLQEKDVLIAEKEQLITEHEHSFAQLNEEVVASKQQLVDLNRELALRTQELESSQGELSASRQKERMSSGEILQLMGTVEDLQRRYHQGSQSEGEVIQRMEVETARKMEQLRAELDEMYGQQIVQMKQELRAQHSAEVDRIAHQHSTDMERVVEQHRLELDRLRGQSMQSAGEVNALNAKLIELQQKLQEVQVLREKAKQELAQNQVEKINLQKQVKNLLQDLQSARERAKALAQGANSKGGLQAEAQQLHDTINDLRARLAEAEEANNELEVKHDSEITNYKIKLEMLEREKDAVLDRMAESQEAELERLRTQLLFSHEEELTRLREDLQRESQLNVENLRDELDIRHREALEKLGNGYEDKLQSIEGEKNVLATERMTLLQEIVTLKNDLNQALERPGAETLVGQLKELQMEIELLRQTESERVTIKNNYDEMLLKNKLLLQEMKEKEENWVNKMKVLESDNKALKESNLVMKAEKNSQLEEKEAMREKMETLFSENQQIHKQVVVLQEEIERQKNTYSFAERNFEVNYQELREEYKCLVKAKAQLEERILKDSLENEVKLSSLQSQLQKLQETTSKLPRDHQENKMEDDQVDGKGLIEKHTIELTEKLGKSEREKEDLALRLSEVMEKVTVMEAEVERLAADLKQAREERREVLACNKDLEQQLGSQTQRRLQRDKKATQPSSTISSSTTEERQVLHTRALEEEVQELRRTLRGAEREREEAKEKHAVLVQENRALQARLHSSGSLGDAPVEQTTAPPLHQPASGKQQRGGRRGGRRGGKRGGSGKEAPCAAEHPGSQGMLHRQRLSGNDSSHTHEKQRQESGGEKKEQTPQGGGGDDAGAPPVTPQEDMEGRGHEECRLQLEAQRISLSQIHAAQLELQRENLLAQAQAQAQLRPLQERPAPAQAQDPRPPDAKEVSRTTRCQGLIEVVSEEHRLLIQSFAKVLGEENMEALRFGEGFQWEGHVLQKRDTAELSSLLQEARELCDNLHHLKEAIVTSHGRLLKLQSTLRTDGNKMEALQMAYEELKQRSEGEIASLRSQIDRSHATTQDANASQEQARAAFAGSEGTKVGLEAQYQARIQQQQAHLEQTHSMELQRLRTYYQQQAQETEQRYTTEILLLQGKLQELTGAEAPFSLPSVTQLSVHREYMGEEATLDEGEGEGEAEDVSWAAGRSAGLRQQVQAVQRTLLHRHQQEVAALTEQHRAQLERLRAERSSQEPGSPERGGGAGGGAGGGESSPWPPAPQVSLSQILEQQHQERVEEEIAKVIVQMSVEFAQHTELARITKQARETTSAMQTHPEPPPSTGPYGSQGPTREEALEEVKRRYEEEKEKLERELRERTQELLLLRGEVQRETQSGAPQADELSSDAPLATRSQTESSGTGTSPAQRPGGPKGNAKREAEMEGRRERGGEAERRDSEGEQRRLPSMQSSGTQTEERGEEGMEVGQKEVRKGTAPRLRLTSEPSPHSQDASPDAIATERNLLRSANERLRQVLCDVLKTTAAAEETIGRHVEGILEASSRGRQEPHEAQWQRSAAEAYKNLSGVPGGPGADLSKDSCHGSETAAAADDTSVWSGTTETDEGLEVSQRLADLESEECLMGISTRLQSAVEKLLHTITETSIQVEHAKATQTELMRESFRHNQEISELLRRQEELQEQLAEEGRAREQLALELHRAEGLIDGYSGERATRDEQLRQKVELQQQLEQELQVTSSRLQELEQERLHMQQERELLARQQDAMKEKAGLRELRLVDAAVAAAPEADLLEETEKLMKEKVEAQRQSEKENTELQKQVKLLEGELEEQMGRAVELEQAHRAETADLTQQIQALEKQLENNRKFLDEQAVDREHERDVFQQEIQKLEQQLKNPQKLQPSNEQRHTEVEELRRQLQEKADWCSELQLATEQQQRDVRERDEELERLGSRVRELEQALLSTADAPRAVEEHRQHAPMSVREDTTLEAQLQTEREALDRKEKEICNLEEQLEQFREELENKSEEVQQLHMQLEIQRKELSTQQEDLEAKAHLLQVLEEKDRELAVLNEQIAKLRPSEAPPDNQTVEQRDELLRELELQLECMRGEQERLQRNSEEEVDQLNAVIEKLQQELAHIEHRQPEEFLSSHEEETTVSREEYDEMKQKMDQVTQELDTLKAERGSLPDKHGTAREERATSLAVSSAREGGDGLAAGLEEALTEKTAAVVVMQAQVHALEQSASTRVADLSRRVEELEVCVEEKDSELQACRLRVEQAQADAHALHHKVSELEEKLREKVAAMLVSQAQLGAVQAQTKELQGAATAGGGKHSPVAGTDVGVPRLRTEDRDVRSGTASAGKVGLLTEKLKDLEEGLSGMQKDQELQKQLLSSSEEEVLEYERRLAVLMDLLNQMRTKPAAHRTILSAQTTEGQRAGSSTPIQAPGGGAASMSELLQKLQDLQDEAAATKEELNSHKEHSVKLQVELQVKDATIAKLQTRPDLQKASVSGDEEGSGAVAALRQELKHIQDEAAASIEELRNNKEHSHRLQSELQIKDTTIAKLQADLKRASIGHGKEDSAAVAVLRQGLQDVQDEAAASKEELRNYRESCNKLKDELQAREMTIALLKDQLHKAPGGDAASLSELLQELQEVRDEAAATKEELSSYRERSDKLQDELQDREQCISQLQAELQQLREALSRSAEEQPSSQPKRKGSKHSDNKQEPLGKAKAGSSKDKPSLSRKNSSLQSEKSSSSSSTSSASVNGASSVTRADVATQVDLGPSGGPSSDASEEVAVVIGEYTERIDQMQELHAAEIMDMEARHISESESLRREAQELEEECKALKAVIDKLRGEGVRSEHPAASQFKDGYTSDSSSDWSQRTGQELASLQPELRTTPEGARRDNEPDPLPDKIKTLLREVHQEGMQVLSLSELPVTESDHATTQLHPHNWGKERDALLATVESLKALITKLQTHRETQGGDWRGDLVGAVQQVFARERDVLKAALYSQLDLLDTSDAVIHLNQLERTLSQQDARYRQAMGELHTADRNSLLAEIRQLRATLEHLQTDPSVQDPTPLQQHHQVASTGLVDPGAAEERRVGAAGSRAQDQSGSHADRLMLGELKGELAQTKLELETTLKAQHKHLKELDALRTEVAQKVAEVDKLNDKLAAEQKSFRELQWSFEKQKSKSEKKQESEREELEDLKLAHEEQQALVAQLSASLGQEQESSALLQQQLDGERNRQHSLISELQVQLESQRARAQELSSALERERELHAQLRQKQAGSSPAQQPAAPAAAGIQQAEAGCSLVEEEVSSLEALLQTLQQQLDEKHTQVVRLVEEAELHKLEAVQAQRDWQEEKAALTRGATQDQNALREARANLARLEGRVQELQAQVEREREKVGRLERERDRLQERVTQLTEREGGAEGSQQADKQSQTAWQGESQPVDRTRDWVLQQKVGEGLIMGSSTPSMQEHLGVTQTAPSGPKHMDNVISRLKLIASKIKNMTSTASDRLSVEGPDREGLVWIQSNMEDVVSMLQQVPVVPPTPESAALVAGGSSVLTERLLRQNAELTGFVSRLTEEKNDLRNQLLKLEEEVRRLRQRGLGSDTWSRKGSDKQEVVLFSSEREAWGRERLRLEKALRQAEAELTRLRGEMRADALRDMSGPDADNATLRRIYGKYLRSESFRKALIYQKKYLLLLLGGFQECEEATLALIARMGGRPSNTALGSLGHQRRGFTRFRSAVRVSIALTRMRFLVRRWQRAAGATPLISPSVTRNGVGQITGGEGRVESPYLQPGSVEIYGERRGTTRGRSGRDSPRSAHSVQHRFHGMAGDSGGVSCPHLQNYDPDRALTDYISRLEALQRRLGSVQSGSSSYAQLHFGIRR